VSPRPSVMPTWDGMSDPPPNERRVDGGKVTEMVSVNEWLADPNKNRLVPDPELIDPPHLPAFAYRDHLHDNTRAHGLFDTANPGITTYVRSSRRIVNHDPQAEKQLQQARQQQRRDMVRLEQKDIEEKNEILELRSLGIRAAMQKYKDLQDNDQDGGRAHSHDGVSKITTQGAFFM